MHPHFTLQWCSSCVTIGTFCSMEHDTLSNFLNYQRILFVMIASLSMILFYFLTTFQLFYINFLAFRNFLQNFVFPLNLVNMTFSKIELNMSVMIWLQTETVQLLPSSLCFKTGLSHPTVSPYCLLLAYVVFTTGIAPGSRQTSNHFESCNVHTIAKPSLSWDGHLL